MHDDSYELFRQAVVARDVDAWATLVARYRPLLIIWVLRCRAAEATGERYEDLADEAFARAWRALSPERFAGFPSLAPLLGYLRACVAATVIDAARTRAMHDRLAQRVEPDVAALPEHAVIERLGRDQLWQMIMSLVANEAERVVLIERFVLDLPPRAIQARHPTLFPGVAAIYAALRNLCERLRRHKDLQRFYTEHLAT